MRENLCQPPSVQEEEKVKTLQQGCTHHFRSKGDKLLRDLLSDLSSSRNPLHLSVAETQGKPHKHKQHNTRKPTL